VRPGDVGRGPLDVVRVNHLVRLLHLDVDIGWIVGRTFEVDWIGLELG
jgi:hypothetical protein